jgi:hypothetical protein
MEHPRKKYSPEQKLANFYESLTQDLLDGHIKPDRNTIERGGRVARTILDKVTAPGDWANTIDTEKLTPKGPSK